jgi:hypothetical protein
MYFIRRAFATLWEMDSAFHKLNMLKEVKNRKRSLDRKRLKKWVAAVAFFSRTKKFIDSQQSYVHGHSAFCRASSRRSGGTGLLTGGDPDPGQGSAHLRVRRAVPGFPRFGAGRTGPVASPWSERGSGGRVD